MTGKYLSALKQRIVVVIQIKLPDAGEIIPVILLSELMLTRFYPLENLGTRCFSIVKNVHVAVQVAD